MGDERDHDWMISKIAHDWHKRYLTVLQCRSTVSGADGICEEVKNVDVLIPGRSGIEHHFESIKRLFNFQTSTCNELLVEDAR